MGFSTPPTEIFTVYTYEINATFDDGESLISGPITIDGIVVMAYQLDEQGDDDDRAASIEINGVDCTGGGVMYDDGDQVGLMGAIGAGGTLSVGLLDPIRTNEVAVPHTSFDVKNEDGDNRLFHRTIKVVVLNRT